MISNGKGGDSREISPGGQVEEEEEEEYETADSGVSEQSSTTSSSTDSLTLNRKRKQQGANQDNASSSGAVKGRLLVFPLFLPAAKRQVKWKCRSKKRGTYGFW